MSNPLAASGNGDESSGSDKDLSVAKTAGFVVFSGIAVSILKTLNPFSKDRNQTTPLVSESTRPIPDISSPLPPEPIIAKKSSNCLEPNAGASSGRTVEIVKGDTLWGLSRKYEVSIDAIKEANGLTGDTIYAGKKLIIPFP
ncbi:uncharacterized protein LOC110824635 [Carica papaya]|uniref:uncharacterized protein LOC110824635 n=1 Tax=Carica papaya TaxID=3649 RepID=UPI000B8CB78E|nr:uncharacterized protein LOC110824635 [Carica papaya]